MNSQRIIILDAGGRRLVISYQLLQVGITYKHTIRNYIVIDSNNY